MADDNANTVSTGKGITHELPGFLIQMVRRFIHRHYFRMAQKGA